MLARKLIKSAIGNTRTFIFTSNQFDFDLRDHFESVVGQAPVGTETINVFINQGVVFGGSSVIQSAFDTGSWPSGVIINLFVAGYIAGVGGDGGDGQTGDNTTGQPGGDGGVGLRVQTPLNLHLLSGAFVQGGGGGGAGGGGDQVGFGGPFNGGGGGGGGAGSEVGLGGSGGYESSGSTPGEDGTLTTGGFRGHDSSSASNLNGGSGGDPGENGGSSGSGGFGLNAPGGDGGDAVVGWSNVTEIVSDGTYKGDKTG